MLPPPSPGSTPRGFSLLEMLVAVAIVMVLAALVVTFSSRLQASSKNTACVANLHRAGIAMQHYIADMGNKIVTRYGGVNRTAGDMWGAELSGRGYLKEAAREDGYRSHTGADPKLLQCPAGALPADFSMTNWPWYTYGLNMFSPGLRTQSVSGTDLASRSTLGIEKPSEFVLLADSAMNNGNIQWFRISSGNNAGLALRHKGHGNVLFLDGHIESIGLDRAKELGFPAIYEIEN